MKKELGQVFTPEWIVNLMLNKISYNDSLILHKNIIEPSCGDGAFLKEIVKRYIEVGLEEGLSLSIIKEGLESHIYGIEYDNNLFQKCINNLNDISSQYNIHNVSWNIINQDAIMVCIFNKKMDYVIGNPPYVRTHNIDNHTKNYLRENYKVCKSGMVDLYIAFYELGINMLNDNGVLSFITPNTFMYNTSAKTFRKFIEEKNILSQIINFGTELVFDASTYTAITTLKQNKKNSLFEYYTYKDSHINLIGNLNLNDYRGKSWTFTSDENLSFLNAKLTSSNVLGDLANIQYGFATLRDKIYISSHIENIDDTYCKFNGFKIERELLYPVVKGSKFNGEVNSKIIYPYKKNCKGKWVPILEDEMKTKYPYLYDYFLYNKEELLARKSDDNIDSWFQFGRSQGIQSMHNEKLVVDIFVKGGTNTSINVYKLPSEVFVYSGIFITGNNLDKILKVIQSKEFYKYISIVGKDLRNGYKTLSTKMIKNYSFS